MNQTSIVDMLLSFAAASAIVKKHWKFHISWALAGALACGGLGTARGDFIDNFDYADNAALQAVWGAPALGGNNATGFTYSTGTGTLHALGMTDSSQNVGFAAATFFRGIAPIGGDFVTTLKLNYDAAAVNQYGMFAFEARHAGGAIASGGVWDESNAARGLGYTQIGGSTSMVGPTGNFDANPNVVTGASASNKSAVLSAAPGTLTVKVGRIGSQVFAHVRGYGNIQAAGSTADLEQLALKFIGWNHTAAPGSDVNALYGNTANFFAVDRVQVISNPLAGTTQRVISDTDFAVANWTATVIDLPGNNPMSPGADISASPTQMTEAGNNFRRMAHNIGGNDNAWYGVFHKFTAVGAAYDPGTEGEIVALSYSQDHRLVLNAGVGFNFALEQDGKIYEFQGVRPVISTVTAAWQTYARDYLTVEDFKQTGPLGTALGGSDQAIGSIHPDFSAAGGEITFGFIRWNGTNVNNVHDIDNFNVTIYSIPEPAACSLAALGMLGLCGAIRKRRIIA